MAQVRLYSRSFAGGEISRDMWGRLDDAKYQSGLAECVNFIVRPQGVLENRPGTTFIRFAKYDNRRCRLVPFVFSSTQSMVVELGHQYARFHIMGLTLMNGASPYEIVTPWAEVDLFDLRYVQSADVMTFTHPGYPPQELRRFGALDWRIEASDFAPTAAPTGVSAAATVAESMPPSITYSYVVTRVRDGDGSESTASAASSVTNNLYVTGNKNTITWTAGDAGTREYLVYKMIGGSYGFIGRTSGLSMVDDNIAPDMSRTPPLYDPSLAASWPAAVAYLDQRKVFAGAALKPQNVWMTRVGTENGLTYSIPVRDDDRISVRVSAREVNAIRHLVPMQDLLLLTSSGEWRVTASNSDVITPTTISVKPQSYIGASRVQPLLIGRSAIFCGERGGHMYEIGYNWQAQGYQAADITLRCSDAFDIARVVDLAYQKAPYPIVWAAMENGDLKGMTYVPEQQVYAWHTQRTKSGAFESVCVVQEYDLSDLPYVVVRRQLGGVWRRCIERIHWRVVGSEGIAPAYAHFADCGVSVERSLPSSFVGGLEHLEGETVCVQADGAVMPPRRVVGGSVTLDAPARIVSVGLPIVAQARTLPVFLPGGDPAFGQGRMKNINKLWLRVRRSSGIKAGPSLDALREVRQRRDEPYGTPAQLLTEEVELPLEPSWEQGGGQVYIVQDQPLPLQVLAVTAEVVIGG